MLKEIFSEKFGWKPKEIDELTAKEVEYYSRIIAGRNKRIEYESSKGGKK
ncbi:MAG: hypothetical protein AB1467_06820 [Candidatus Diapherotrites archaeon]